MIFEVRWALKLLTNVYLRDLSPGENAECPFMMRSPWQSKAESPKPQ